MTTMTIHLNSEDYATRMIVATMGHWQRLTLILIGKQGFERSTPFRPRGEIGRLIDDQVLRHDTLRVDGVTQYALLPGRRFTAVMLAMRDA